MSGCLYFPNNFKNIRDHIKLQNLFPINVNSFQRKPKLTYPFYFAIVLGLYLKQYLFQTKLERTGLDRC